MSDIAKVLVVKLSSMGDVIHTLPALTDASRALPGVRFDWVVEEGFAEIPAWHPAVDRVIPVAFRRWRKNALRELLGPQWRAARRDIGRDNYDCVVDAQGLIKSAVVTRLGRGRRCGPDRQSAREGLAALAYDDQIDVPRAMHAIARTRLLFARALGYPVPDSPADAGIAHAFELPRSTAPQGVWFLHGTARDEKTWPESHWLALAQRVADAGYAITIPAGNAAEQARARRIASDCSVARVLSGASLGELAAQLATATAVVAVDTGLGHLAAALGIPCVSLYGPTDPARVGACGANQLHLRAPSPGDMSDIAPDAVWSSLQGLLDYPRNTAVAVT